MESDRLLCFTTPEHLSSALASLPPSPASSPQIEAPLATNFTAALMGKGWRSGRGMVVWLRCFGTAWSVTASPLEGKPIQLGAVSN
jgi:hypothetical protein